MSVWPAPETKLDIGLRKLRDYGGGAVLSDAEAWAVLGYINDLRDQVNSGRRTREALEGLPEGTIPRV